MKSCRILFLAAIGCLFSTGCDTQTLEALAAAAASSGYGQSGSAYGPGYHSDPYENHGYGYDPAPHHHDEKVPYGVRSDSRKLDTATDQLKLEVERFLRTRKGKPSGGFKALEDAARQLESASDRFSWGSGSLIGRGRGA